MTARSDRRLIPFAWVVIGSGAVVLAVEARRLAAVGLEGVPTALVAGFAALALLAELRPVAVSARRRSDVVISAGFLSAILVLTPGLVGAVIAAAVSLLGDLVAHRTPLKTAFNAANATLMMAAGAAVLHLGGVPPLAEGVVLGLDEVLVMAVACGVLFLISTATTSTVVALATEQPVRGAVRRDLALTSQTDGILLPLGPVHAVLALEQPWLLPLGVALFAVVFGTARFAADQRLDASIDPLTGLANRREIDAEGERLLEQAATTGQRVALLMMDLDGFKPINDSFGHDVGDEVLVEVAERTRAEVGDAGAVARMGGDEFVVVMPVGGPAEALALADRIHRAVALPMVAGGAELRVSSSVGVAVHPGHGRTLAELTRAADAAMYGAKRERLGCLLADEAGRAMSVPLLTELSRALSGDGEGLALEYQPVLDTRTGAVVGAEALLRWTHPVLGPVDPGDIIRQAESTPVIRALTDWVVGHAVRTAADLAGRGHRLRIAVNVSPRDMADPAFTDRIGAVLAAHGLDGGALMVELTETGALEDIDGCAATCERLAAMGVTVALDDFGTGQRSIAELRRLPVSAIKLDRSLIDDLGTVRGRGIAEGLVAMAGVIGVQTIAEGIDSPATRAVVQRIGCEQMQGYGLASPMPEAELRAWLAGRASLDDALPAVAPTAATLATDPL
jgi:diguanylate cyclase (GGDEF)-like protein